MFMSYIYLWGENYPRYSLIMVWLLLKDWGECLCHPQPRTLQGKDFRLRLYLHRLRGLSGALVAWGLVNLSGHVIQELLYLIGAGPHLQGQDRGSPGEDYKKQHCQLKVDTQN